MSAAAVVAVALTVGAFVLLWSFRSSLEANLDQTLQQQADDRVALIEQGTDPSSLANTRQEEALVWIGHPDGTPIAVGGPLVPLENPVPEQLGTTGGATLLIEELKPGGAEIERAELRLASAVTADGTVVVVAAAEAEQLDQTLAPLAKLFAAAIPILVLVVALLAWKLAGRALRPVERIRRQTTTLSGSNLSERVPVPKGNDEIHHLALTMNEMLGRLEAHERALRQFTADASHELKSPVANIRTMIETTEMDDPGWPGLQSTLEVETDRLRDLVDNLLFLAGRADGATSKSAMRPVHIDDLLFDEAELLALTKRAVVDIGGVKPATVQGDPAALQRLVRNLADNAARYSDSKVTFASTQRPTDVTITISDDGPGIAPEDRERVFERFARLDSARDRDDGGAGLGLAIVRQIAIDHSATVDIGGCVGSGAEVTVTLPIDPAP